MGIHSKNNRKTKLRARRSKNNSDNNFNTNNNESTATIQPTALPCVTKLHSTDWNIVEEGCADVATFALQPAYHKNLIAHNVPKRLVELLFTSSVSLLNVNNSLEEQQQQQQQQEHTIHRGVLYLQIAAAEALRNFVVNSSEDIVVDLLASICLPPSNLQQEQQGVMFSDKLMSLLLSTWELTQKARREAPLEFKISIEKENDETEHNICEGNYNSSFMLTIRTLDEILQLITVCVEGSEQIAKTFSSSQVLQTILSILLITTNILWETLQHPARLYHTNMDKNNNNNNIMWIRQYKRHEAELLAAVAVAASEVLHVLSGDNKLLASLLQSSELMAPYQSFLTNALDATAIMTWLRDESPSSSSSSSLSFMPFSSVPSGGISENNGVEVEDTTLLVIGRQNIFYQLCEISLHMQGTLLNSAPNPTNALRVLPLAVTILNAHPPHREWRRTVPLLLQECTLPEEYRNIFINRALWRLRCDQAAVNVLHAVVDIVCGLNETELDDETAFQQNPHADFLYKSQSMYVVGQLMRDALQLPLDIDKTNNNNNNNSGGGGGGGDSAHMSLTNLMNSGEEDILVEQALRAAAGASGAGGLITKLQQLVLSNEVGVWSLANTLLMMVPWTGLGEEPSQIWRAIINALSTRSQLLTGATMATSSTVGRNEVEQTAVMTTMVTSSPAALNLLRLQLESLVQMLWTLQRKQVSQAGGPLQVTNNLLALVTDVDVVTRLAWESNSSQLQRQACVGVVCNMCNSFKNTDAINAATRFALGMLQINDELQAKFTAMLSLSSLPTGGGGGNNGCVHRQWLANIVTMDGEWRVRCEAANNIMDLFLDETYDEVVYIPLQVHSALKLFLSLFQTYMKRRQQMARDAQKNYRIVLPEIGDMPHWCEVADNLSAFLDYKVQQIGRQRLQ